MGLEALSQETGPPSEAQMVSMCLLCTNHKTFDEEPNDAIDEVNSAHAITRETLTSGHI
jgi:hypothetical protein